MSSHQEAIIYVPGFQRDRERDFYMASLTSGLTEQLENLKVEEVGDAKIPGNLGKRFKVYINEANIKYIDLYEAYWEDLNTKKLSEDNLKNKLFRGGGLLYYWFFSKIWFSFGESTPLFIGLILSLFLGISWYYGTIAIAFIAIGKDPNLFGFELHQDWANFLSNLGQQMGGWSVWLIVSALLSFIPINIYVDMADFIARYLEESSEGRFIRAKVRKRVANTLNNVLDENIYERVTIVAHSFGVTIATDLLADYDRNEQIYYITLGGALKFLSYKAEWIKKEIIKSLNNNKIEYWIDFYSNEDWLCTKTPLPKKSNSQRIQTRQVFQRISLWRQLKGKSHDHYFTNTSVLKAILNL